MVIGFGLDFSTEEILLLTAILLLAVISGLFFALLSAMAGKWLVYGREYLSYNEEDVAMRNNALTAVVFSVIIYLINGVNLFFLVPAIISFVNRGFNINLDFFGLMFMLISVVSPILAIGSFLISRKRIERPLARDKKIFSYKWIIAFVSLLTIKALTIITLWVSVMFE
jgi:hypothetical protein